MLTLIFATIILAYGTDQQIGNDLSAFHFKQNAGALVTKRIIF